MANTVYETLLPFRGGIIEVVEYNTSYKGTIEEIYPIGSHAVGLTIEPPLPERLSEISYVDNLYRHIDGTWCAFRRTYEDVMGKIYSPDPS